MLDSRLLMAEQQSLRSGRTVALARS